MNRLLSCSLIFLVILSGCKTFYPNEMFKTDEDYKFVEFDSLPPPEYIIQPGDRVEFSAFTNRGDGYVRTLFLDFNGEATGQARSSDYLVQHDGMIEFPVLGKFHIAGYSIPEAEELIENQLGEQYVDPMVLLRVTNRRIFVFIGSEDAQVLTLDNENISLIEVLAMAGGLNDKNIAERIKVIRGTNKDPLIDLIDLSTIEGMKEANLIVRANDIIYVETRNRFTAGFIEEVSPILTLVGTLAGMVSLYLLVTRTTN